jgi:hypothetical protein
VSTPSSCIFTPLGYVCKWTALGLLAWCWEKAQLHYQILGASSRVVLFTGTPSVQLLHIHNWAGDGEGGPASLSRWSHWERPGLARLGVGSLPHSPPWHPQTLQPCKRPAKYQMNRDNKENAGGRQMGAAF